MKNGFSRTNNNIAVIGAKHVGVVIRSLTFKEGYTTDEKLNSGTDNKRFYYKLLNWELNRHVQLTSMDSSTKFMFLMNIIKSWTANATNRRCYAINMHSTDYRDYICFDNGRNISCVTNKIYWTTSSQLLWNTRYQILKLKRNSKRLHWKHYFSKKIFVTSSEEIEKSNKNFKIFKNMIHQNELVTASESGESISESGDSLI